MQGNRESYFEDEIVNTNQPLVTIEWKKTPWTINEFIC